MMYKTIVFDFLPNEDELNACFPNKDYVCMCIVNGGYVQSKKGYKYFDSDVFTAYFHKVII